MYREKPKIFQSIFIPTLIYGLDSLTLQHKHLKRIDAFCIRFLRHMVGIKASYYSRSPNSEVYRRAGEPRKPSQTLKKLQLKMLRQVFGAGHNDPIHHVVFSPGLKDRTQAMGRCRGGKIPYWVEATTQRSYAELWRHFNARNVFGPNFIYTQISKSLKLPAVACQCARERAPGSSKKTLNPD